jgi:hypothetical protein
MEKQELSNSYVPGDAPETIVLGDQSNRTEVRVTYWLRVKAGRHTSLLGPYDEAEFAEARRDGVKIVHAEKSTATGTYVTEEIPV